MATRTAHELSYDVERVLERHMKRLRIPKARSVAQEIAPDIIREIPSEAFDPVQPWSVGKLFFHGDVEEDHCKDLQYDIALVHQNMKKATPISLYLSSLGGDCYSGLALISTIQEVRRAGRQVNVHIQGCAMSMGSLIAQVADLRTIEPQAWFMIHSVSTWMGRATSTEVHDEAEYLDRLEQRLFSQYSARTGRPVEFWRKLFHRRDVYLSAEQALEYGLVDEIATVPPYPRVRRRKAA